VQLGSGSVIEGWEKGLVGIRKGGRRMLTIPPEMGYGAEGYPPDIPPNETLVFVVDAVAVQ
jgi:peptidylprolyl isomerase